MSGIRDRDAASRFTSDVAVFQDLEVFRRAYQISLDLHRASMTCPKVERNGLADQIRHTSKSICGNIAEGFWQAATIECRVQAPFADGDWVGGRDAGSGEVLLGFGMH